MPVLYIANASKQSHSFNYRLPEKEKLFMQKIEVASQISINLNSAEIDWVLKQHLKYGMVDVKSISNKKGFSGICYSIDKPVNVETIMIASEVKDEVITDRALDIRKTTAAAVEKSVSEQAQEMGIQAGNTQFEIEEQKTNPADNEAKFKETIEVTGSKRRGRAKKD